MREERRGKGEERREQAEKGVGSLSPFSFHPSQAVDPAPSSPTLVVQTAFLGDVVLTTPLLFALADRYGAVDVVTTPAAAALLEGHPAVASVVRYDKRGADAGLRGLWTLGRRLRQRRYARAFLPHRSLRSAALALIAGAPERTGFAGSAGAVTYTSRVPRPLAVHETARLLALAGVPPERAPEVSLCLTAQDRAAADGWMHAHGVPPGFVAVAPGSIWGTKQWPHYAELAAALDAPIVVIGSAHDAALAAEISAAALGRVWNAAGALGLRAAAALLERAAVLVTNDSVPLHLATAVHTPVVAIFGPTVPEFGFGPLGRRDVVVQQTELACRPCSAHGPRVCPLGHHRCMVELSVERVAAAVSGISGREVGRAVRTGD